MSSNIPSCAEMAIALTCYIASAATSTILKSTATAAEIAATPVLVVTGATGIALIYNAVLGSSFPGHLDTLLKKALSLPKNETKPILAQLFPNVGVNSRLLQVVIGTGFLSVAPRAYLTFRKFADLTRTLANRY